MFEGFFLGCSLLVMVWVVYATWKPLKTLSMAMMMTALVWIPSLLYPSKLFHFAGYVLLPGLVVWHVAEQLKRQRGERTYAPTE
ncbi:hypothetical protein [Brevibacillus marinus]|uniref:hypothetical protein n=1 Tax=Brevibacillus marinus TaxID=2496837 RepID=UPI000F83A21F|nr:hypothetical protein [Brevibacillus marinus]